MLSSADRFVCADDLKGAQPPNEGCAAAPRSEDKDPFAFVASIVDVAIFPQSEIGGNRVGFSVLSLEIAL